MKLSIGVLISNRIETVKKCLDSLKPLLDAGIAELICVDTVSATEGLISDGSAELARQYATKVIEFPWIRDFSRARNITLENATGEWYLYVDDDEWFEDAGDLVKFFSDGEYKKYWSASYIVRNYKNKQGSEWADTRLVRLVKRTESLHFEGKVHEGLSEIHLPCKELQIFAHHYGYAFDTEEEKAKHRERNLSLLQDEIKERPQDLRLKAQLALEYANFDNEKALDYVSNTLNECPDQWKAPYYQWMIALQFPLYEAMEKGLVKLMELYNRVHNSYTLCEFAELSIAYNTARQFLIADDPIAAGPYLEDYFKYYDILINDGKKRQLQDTADFAKYISDSIHEEAVTWLEYSKRVYENRKKKPLLTIGILVSNRKEYIRKCMESIKPMLDSIPAELIAVDTVGREHSDGSIDIVREYTDKVYRFEWCNDFAAARNVTIEHAKGSWYLFLDDDEWFEDPKEIIEFFASGEYQNYKSGVYKIKDHMADGSFSFSAVARMIELKEDSCFVGKIHESFNSMYLPCKYFSCYAHHMGYYFMDEAARERHFERNMSLLRAEFEEEGYKPGLCAQIVQECLGTTAHVEYGIEFCIDSINHLAEVEGNALKPEFQWMLTTLVRYEANQDNYEGMLGRRDELLDNFELSNVAKAAIYSVVAGQAAKKQDLDTFFDSLMAYLDCYDAILADMDKALLDTAFDFPKFYDRSMYYELLWYGAAFANKIGEYSVANMFWKRFDFASMEPQEKAKYAADMQDTLEGIQGRLT